jgi:hypothetical protein
MGDYSMILKPVLIAIGIAIVAGVVIKLLEKFLVRLFSKKK